MLNYIGFLNEGRDHRNKIKKFANIEQIYSWAHKYDADMSLWIADKVVKTLKSRIKDKKKLKIVEEYLTTGKTKKEEDAKAIRSLIGKVKTSLTAKFRKVLDYVNSPLHRNKPNINKLSLKDAVQRSDDWHEEIKANADNFLIEEEIGELVMDFPDGFYWIDLATTECSDEASQIKGKGNTKPIEKYHPYIVDLICHLDVTGYRSEHNKSQDFHPEDLNTDLHDKLNDCNPAYIENDVSLSDDEIEEKYREELDNGLLEEDIEGGLYNGDYLFYYVDDAGFLENIIDGEVDHYCYGEEFRSRFRHEEEDMKSYIEKHVSDEGLNSHLNKSLEDDLEEIRYDWGYDEDEEYKEGELDELNDLLKERREKSNEDLIEDIDIDELEEILDTFSIKEDFVRNEIEDQWGDAEEYYNSLYGKSENLEGKEFLNIFGYYFERDKMIDRLITDCDPDILRDQYDW